MAQPDGSYKVAESWSVTIAENNGQTPTFSKTYHGTESGTLVVSNGNYTLIDKTGLNLETASVSSVSTPLINVGSGSTVIPNTWHTPTLDTSRIIYGGIGGYEIDGSYPVAAFAGNYAIVQFSFFMVKVQLPVTDFAIPVLGGYGSDIYTTTGVSLDSLSGYGNETDDNTGFTASGYSMSSMTPVPPSGAVAPKITTQPISQTVLLGDSPSFSVNATGTEPLSYQWKLNGTNLTDGGEYSGSTNSTLNISGAEAPDAGSYSVYVSNVKGSVTSAKAVLTIGALLTLQTNGNGTISPNDNGKLLPVGQTYNLTAKPATGYGFVKWTDGQGNIVSTKAVLQFLMASNLTLQANFVDVTLPTISITSPTAGLLVSNTFYNITGKCADNVAVSNVWVQLNNTGFNPAATFSGTNWTKLVSLTPGTNTVQAFAVDMTGNHSLTNTVKLFYAVNSTLTVTINGNGTISPPNYTNVSLNIGKGYTLKATAAKGFGFYYWGGVLLSNNPTLNFIMSSNLMITANFRDVTRPVATITSPTANQLWTNNVITVSGKASDNVGVSNVWVQMNNGGWTAAGLTGGNTNWSVAGLPVSFGTNIIRAFAVDAAGNASLTNTVKLTGVLAPPLLAGYAATLKPAGTSWNTW